jgi:hypothetical protein
MLPPKFWLFHSHCISCMLYNGQAEFLIHCLTSRMKSEITMHSTFIVQTNNEHRLHIQCAVLLSLSLFFFCLGDDFDFHFVNYSSFNYCPNRLSLSLVVVNLMKFMYALVFCKMYVQRFSWFSSCSTTRMCEIHFVETYMSIFSVKIVEHNPTVIYMVLIAMIY